MILLSVYARKRQGGDVEIYRDPEMTRPFCTFDRWRSSKPTKRNKWITLNCYRWKLIWID